MIGKKGEVICDPYMWIYKDFLKKNCTHIEINKAISIIKKRMINLSSYKYNIILHNMEEFGFIEKTSKRHYKILTKYQEEAGLREHPFWIF